jgi:hypothetical protein
LNCLCRGDCRAAVNSSEDAGATDIGDGNIDAALSDLLGSSRDNQLIARLHLFAGVDIAGDHWARYTFLRSRLVVPAPGGAQGART